MRALGLVHDECKHNDLLIAWSLFVAVSGPLTQAHTVPEILAQAQ